MTKQSDDDAVPALGPAAPAPGTTTSPPPARVPANVRLFVALAALLLVLFAILRLVLVLGVRAGGDASAAELARAFLTGARFDLSIACFLLAPILVLCYVPWTSPWRGPRTRRAFVWVVSAVVAVLGLVLVAEVEFFREFQTRYNQLALRYLDHPEIVGGMVWYNYPVVRYLLAWAAGAAVVFLGVRAAVRWAGRAGNDRRAGTTTNVSEPGRVGPDGPRVRTLPARGRRTHPLAEVAGVVLVVAALVVGGRGGLQAEPLRWGDAFRGDNEFASQMSLNGLWCLAQAARETLDRGERSGGWAGQLPEADANRAVRRLVVGPGEVLDDPADRAVLRQGTIRTSLTLRTASGRPPNVVVVMMESFSARFCGAAGAPRSVTPSFDALAKDGVLFDRCFSAGSHTHQGIFATQLGFPNLPGYETLMESGAGNQEFLSLPAIFQARKYQTFFLYNGNFAWDNMRGFFRKQGVDTFVGGDEMLAGAKFRDHVWGVSDGDLFDRCNKEFQAAHERGPFYAAVMTLSNHAPFEVPPVPGRPPVTDVPGLGARLTAMQYADYAVGQFVEDAKRLSYFNDTLFVFVGDHGFAVRPVLTEVNLLYHHVPLLFYAPGLTDRRGVDHRVASHTNVVPSVVGLLGLADAPQAAWGRSLFDDGFADANFAVFKMSGGGKAVALARGDELLVLKDAKADPQLLTYTLWPPAVAPATDPGAPARKREMARELKAYVQEALADLTSHQAGPEGPAGGR